jgi:phosphoribosylformylglycinamidine synthase
VLGEATEEEHLKVADELLGDAPVDLPMNVLFGKPPKMQREFDRADFQRQTFRRQRYRSARSGAAGAAVACGGEQKLPDHHWRSFGDRLVNREQMVGPWQVPVADCAVTASGYNGYTGEAMAMGERTPLALIDAAASGRMAVAESITNIAAADIGELSKIKLSANWMAAAGHPGEDANLFDTVQAVGMELCPALGIAIPWARIRCRCAPCGRIMA